MAGLRGDDPDADERLRKRIPLLAGKQPAASGAAAFVCRDYACQAPTDDPAGLRRQIGR